MQAIKVKLRIDEGKANNTHKRQRKCIRKKGGGKLIIKT